MRNVSISASSSHLSNGENSATRVWRFRGTRVYAFFFSLAMHARAQSVCLCFFLFSRFIQNLCFACVFFLSKKQFQVVFFYGVQIRRHRTRMRIVLRRVRQSARVRAKAVRKIWFGICPDTVRCESCVSRARLMCPIVITECIFVQVF